MADTAVNIFDKKINSMLYEGWDKIAFTFILIKLIIILSLILVILNKEKNNEFLKQIKLVKYFC